MNISYIFLYYIENRDSYLSENENYKEGVNADTLFPFLKVGEKIKLKKR